MFEITVTGREELERAFTAFGGHLRDFRPRIWPKVNAQFSRLMIEHFDSGGGSGSTGSWAPLSQNYGAWKAKHYPGEPILELTGTLRRSLTGSFAPGAHYMVTPSLYERGTSVPYAVFHQYGTSGMVPRPPIDFTDAQAETFRDTAMEEFREIAVELGLAV